MRYLLNQSAVQGTALRNKTISRARFRLTILYTTVFGTLVILLSGVSYYLFAADIHEDMSSVFPEKSEQVRIINQHKGKLRNLMLLIDTGVLCFIAASSYYLAGVTLKPIEENYEAQKRFVADTSHDLRTPIAVLKADLEIYLLDRKLPGFLRPIFKSYLEEVDHMKSIVENLLLLFRFDSHQVEHVNERVNLTKLLTSYTGFMQPYAKYRKVNLVLNCIPEIYVSGNSDLLRQAYCNILKNSIEYSDENGVVAISLSRHNRQAIIRVNNKGIGISKKDIKHVFERYSRTAQSRARRSEGTGLGLPVAKQIVEQHRGTISLTSSGRAGTTAHITLPLSGS